MSTQLDNEIYLKLKEAEEQAINNNVRYTAEEVFGDLRKQLLHKI